MSMRRSCCFFLWLALTCAGSLAPRVAVAAQVESVDDVEVARQEAERAWVELNQWLGSGVNGRGWRRFLRSCEIDDQWSLRDRADLPRLQRLRDRLHEPQPGLEGPRFSRLRSAIDRWTGALEQRGYASAVARARQIKTTPRPATADDVLLVRNELQQALHDLDNYLALYGENGARWQKFLQHEDLRGQLKPEAKADLRSLQVTLNRYTSGEPGLDAPPFARVRRALQRFVPRLRIQQDAQFADRYATLVEGLAKRLEAYDESPQKKDRTLREAALTVGWLEEHEQAPDLVAMVRQRYSLPNLYVRVSEDLTRVLMQQQVDRCTPIADCVMGTSISGTGNLHGTLDVEFVPSVQNAIIQTAFHGTIATNTHGVNGPAQIMAVGQTQINAHSRLYLDADGLRSTQTTSRADVNTTITGIGSTLPRLRGRIVRRVASKRAAQSKGQAEAIAGRHAETKFNAEMDQNVREQLSTANGAIQSKMREPLERLSLYPRLLDFRTSPDELMVAALEAGSAQLGAQDAPPALTVPESSLALRVHQSTVFNVFSTLLRDRYLNEEKLHSLANKTIGKIPDELKNDPDQGEWSITFDPVEPMTVEFDDETMKITVFGKAYTSEGSTYDAMNVVGIYRLVPAENGGMKFKRDGELDILPPGFDPMKDKLALRQTTLRTLLKRRFGKLFKEDIEIDGFSLPNRMSKAGSFWIVEHRMDDGWLTLAWKNDLTRPAKFTVSQQTAQVLLSPLELVQR